ncbi:MAG TPA: 30S ribosomal protein S8 [Candidatus Nanoarchaeia archaeon]|nr:30S ribosomal protein S8 [Candidatus Nanoarchaeia archaeon]
MLNDPLAAALIKILNAERAGKKELVVTQVSKIIKKILEIMRDHLYIGSYEEINNGRGLKINLLGNLNKCGVIKPRFSTTYPTIEKWEKRYLPAKDFGIILVSTPKGIVTHHQAKEIKSGGKLIAYCY